MSGLWDRTLVYLGLREETDDDYDGAYDDAAADRGDPAVARFDADTDPHAERAPQRPAARRRAAAETDDDGPATPAPASESSRASRTAAGERRGARAATSADDRTSERFRPTSERTRGTASTTGSSRGSSAGTEPLRSASAAAAPARREVPRSARQDPAPDPAADRPIRRESERGDGSNVTRLPSPDVHVLPVPRGAAVRVEIVTITAFDEVEQVGRRVRAGEPVLFDLRDADATTARRVVDVASGIVYGLHGRLERVGPRAFLVRPRGVEVPEEERRRLDELGYRVPAGSEA